MKPIFTPPPAFAARGITGEQWNDWRWQLASVVRRASDLEKMVTMTEKDRDVFQTIIASAHKNNLDEMRLTPYLISLINWSNENDPIRLQHIPSSQEVRPDDFALDEVWEQGTDFIDGKNRLLQQKYPDIVVVRLSNTCHSFCRFCFEKERTLRHGVPTLAGPEQITAAIKHIAGDTRLRQVLLSGGDPLVMPDDVLAGYVERLSAIPHLRIIRLNTRTVLHNPFRITDELAHTLASIQKSSWENRERGTDIHIGVHFNHPSELTTEAVMAIRKLQRAGLHVYNQTVLLKEINDDAEILLALFRILRQEGVELHYLSEAMAVPGTQHLRTTVRRGQEIMRTLRQTKELRGQLPHFELSHHTGKHIIPDTMNEIFFEDVIEKNGRSVPVIQFVSDITGRWEIFPDGDRE